MDTSALIKRVVDEAESESVFAAIGGSYRRGDVLVSSPLARLELWRSLRRRGISNPSVSVEEALEGLSEFPLDDLVLRAAQSIGNDNLRSLDAIHLASAVMVGAHFMMTFDVRLAEAAEYAGMTTISPGPTSEG